MTQRTIFERTMKDLRAEVQALRQSINQQLLPGKVYTVAELANAIQLSEATIRRAAQAEYLALTRGRILGEEALRWFRAGAPTGRNKGDVNIGGRN